MKFKDFQARVLFSSPFKALNLGEKNSSNFKDAWEPRLLLPSTLVPCAGRAAAVFLVSAPPTQYIKVSIFSWTVL